MVLPLIIGGAALLAGGFFVFQATTTITHWIAILGGIAAGVGLFINLLREVDLGLFESEFLRNLSYVSLSVASGFIVYRLMEAIFASAGYLFAGVALMLVVAAFFLGPSVVVRFLVTVFELIAEVVNR